MATTLTACAVNTGYSNLQAAAKEQLSYEVPASFKPLRSDVGLHETVDRFALTKEGQTAWEQILTVHTFHSTNSLNPKSYVVSILERMRESCSDADMAPLLTPAEESEYNSFEANIFCYHNKKSRRGEVFIIKAISGAKNAYVISRAFRTEPFSKKQISQLVPWLKKFEPTIQSAKVVVE